MGDYIYAYLYYSMKVGTVSQTGNFQMELTSQALLLKLKFLYIFL